MLENTFLHLPGVGEATERLLWAMGITDWRRALEGLPLLPWYRREEVVEGLHRSIASLQAGDAFFFHRLLPPRERWRLFHHFAGSAVCLDIETTGLSPWGSCITLIGLYDGREYRPFVRGHNLHLFPLEVRRYSLVITYNGRRFDLPFIRAEMGPVMEGLAHLDLLYPLRRLGLRGGLKRVEALTGLARPSALEGLDGYDAVVLWRLHQRGHRGALETLVRYNAEDVATLLPLAALVYNLLVEGTGAPAPLTPVPPRPALDLPFDPALVELLRQQKGSALQSGGV